MRWKENVKGIRSKSKSKYREGEKKYMVTMKREEEFCFICRFEVRGWIEVELEWEQDITGCCNNR